MKTIMKSMIAAFAIMMFAVSTSFAQDAGAMEDEQSTDTYSQDGSSEGTITPETQDPQLGQTTPEQGENKTEITKEELPTEVSDAIGQGEYAEWTVAETYEINEQGEKMYEVHFETPEGQVEQETFKQSGEVVAK